MKTQQQCNHHIFLCFTWLIVLFVLSPAITCAQTTSQDNQDAVAQDATPAQINRTSSLFEYQIEGRPDPFMPFITERATSNENPDEIIDQNQVLTGMQLFEPGQLTLVAIMATDSNKFAMVQDFTGKGYIITEGIKVGRRGIVSEIGQNKVLITETAQTRGGKVLTNQIAMVLKKEGEE